MLIAFSNWIATGCTDTSSSESPQSESGTAAAVSPTERQAFLEDGVPPLTTEIAGTPVELADPGIVANEFGQEILSVKYARPVVVRTMAAEATLVLLSPTGERTDIFVQPGVLIQPQDKGTLTGITGGLLDHRGRLTSGLRAYVEMRAATVNGASPTAERVSNVIWIGNQEQLAKAMQMPRTAEPSPVQAPSPSLQPVPALAVTRGAPLWMRTGDRWARGYAMEDEKDGQVKLLIYLVRRDKPFLPWVATLPKSELRMESVAAMEFQANPLSFSDLADANDAKLSRHGVPNELKRVDPSKLEAGTEVLDFWNGMLDPCKTTGPPQAGSVPLQRVGLDNAQMVKPVKDLFLDPFGR